MLSMQGRYAFLLQVSVDVFESPPLSNWILQRFGLGANNFSRAGDSARNLGKKIRSLGGDKEDDIVALLLRSSHQLSALDRAFSNGINDLDEGLVFQPLAQRSVTPFMPRLTLISKIVDPDIQLNVRVLLPQSLQVRSLVNKVADG
jgi:hypothetical protein